MAVVLLFVALVPAYLVGGIGLMSGAGWAMSAALFLGTGVVAFAVLIALSLIPRHTGRGADPASAHTVNAT